VIITDVRMPGLDGMQILEGVRARGWAIPVIVISGASDPAQRKHATALGAHAYLEKPLDTDTLRQSLLDLSRRERWDAESTAPASR
jgi:DNA-binding NtrC family response regulator